MKKLEELQYQIRLAKNAMELELKKRWPINSHVLVKLRHDQKEPTSGVVVGYYDSHISVKIDSAKERSRRPVREIYFTDMVA
jgi:hypothetical protein